MTSHEQKLPTVNTPSELWKHHPDEHDYPAADSYLSLCFDSETAKKLSHDLRKAPIELHKAKDLLRSAELPAIVGGPFGQA